MPRSSRLADLSPIIREDAVILNGRLLFYSRIRDFKKVAPGKYVGRRHDREFTIEGGRKLGGTRRDWFLEMPGYFDRALHCTSVKDALDLLENM